MRSDALSLVMLLIAAAPLFAQATRWDFEQPEVTWQPRSDTVKLARQEGLDATGQGQACLHVTGRDESNWNYASSEPVPMTAGGLYRLSARLRVERLGPATPVPFLKCEFVAADPTRDLGRASTVSDDPPATGQWQRVSVEFQAPAGTVGCWVALEKGTNKPGEVDLFLDEVLLEPITELSAYEKYRLNPIPAPLAARSAHPRLYLHAAMIPALREACRTTHAALWAEVQDQAARAAKSGPPPYIERDNSSGDEQLWQREVGNTMPLLAMAWVVSGDRTYLEAARAWALASCGYATWGLGTIDGMDLATGHQLFGLAIVYDWCYADLDEAARTTIRETLMKRTSAMFKAGAGRAWWQRSYLQNHLWVDTCGMAAAGFALYGEADDAQLWIGLPLQKFRTTMTKLGPDGASHEGIGYWQYGVEYLLKFMALAKDLLGEDMYQHDWWRNTAAYAQYVTLPRASWTSGSSLVDIADCPRGNWYGPDFLLRGLARQYRDGHAQWLAAEIDAANIEAASARWLNLLWYDPSVPAQAPTDLPTLRHFADMGLVSARTDWSGREALVVLKCGPFIGHQGVQEFSYDPGGGHVHPDANHLVLFGNDEWLLRDDGYRAKWTGQHNTLLVGGKGQLGEGQQWFDGGEALAGKARPRITQALSTPELDVISGDATEAYPAALGLRRYVRHLLFLKPDVLLVLDEVELAQPGPLELRFHPEQEAAQQAGSAFLMRGRSSVLRLEPLTPVGVQVSAEKVAGEDRAGGPAFSMFTVRLQTQRASWRNAVALSWAAANGQPTAVTMQAAGDQWTFRAGPRLARFDWRTRQALLIVPAP
jgi:hypothetical protein